MKFGNFASITLMAMSIAIPAHSAVTLEYTFTDVVCGTIDGSGATTFAECATPSFSVSVGPREAQAFLFATLNYHYTDDGLPLNGRGFFQTDWYGHRVETDHEAAALYVRGSGCASRSCNPYTDGVGFEGIVLPLNDHPDDLTGSVRLYTGISQGPWSANLFLSATPEILATPVPELSTWALILLGLGSVVGRRRASIARSGYEQSSVALRTLAAGLRRLGR